MTLAAQTATDVVQVSRHYKANIEQVFAAWSDPEALGQWFGPKCERAILLVLQLLTFACFFALSCFGLMYTLKAWHHSTASLQIPMAIPFAVIPLATAILVLHTAADIIRTLRGKTS